jgi:putative tricarboxylic transport membrane protein
VFRFLLVPASIAAYVFFVDVAGFLPTAAAILFCLFLSGHVRPVRAALLSLCIAFLIHTIFYVGLSVQLPWGIMDPVRW